MRNGILTNTQEEHVIDCTNRLRKKNNVCNKYRNVPVMSVNTYFP